MKNKQKRIPVLKRLVVYSGKKKVLLYFAMFFSALSGVLLLMPMVYIHRIINAIICNGLTNSSLINKSAILAAIFAAGGIISYLFALISSHIFAFEVEDNIIKDNVSRLISHPLGYFLDKESGKIRNTIVGGAAETHTFLAHQLPDLAMTIVTPIVLLVFFFLFDWKLGLISLIPMLIGMGLMATMLNKKMKKVKDEYFNDLTTLSAETVEFVRGIPVVKTYATKIESFDRIYKLINKLKDLVMKLTMGYKNKMSIYESVVGSTAFFLVPVAILFIQYGVGDARQVIANSIIYFLIGPAFGGFIMKSATIAQYSYFAENALNRIDNLLIHKPFEYGLKNIENSSIEFKNVSFGYDEKLVLDDISFEVKKGEMIALVGPSGGGKTTIAQLAARFFDSNKGSIFIGGVDIKELSKENLMNKISFVFQNTKLFKMSIKDNLLIGNPNATNEDINTALENAGALEIIENLKDGLNTVYGAKGTYLSGGEVQRLSIARAFLKDADILILDEATAFSDPENEAVIQNSLKKLAQNKTTLMIAHRLSTVVKADKILVIDNGKIIESGAHKELLKQNGLYTKLWNEYQKSLHWKIGVNHE